VGRLLGFDADTMARSFGLAGSQAAGTFAAWGTPTVKFHQCRGALSGLMAALLAHEGFVATREFLTAADGGLYNTYSSGGKPEAAVADLGTRWELEQIALRLWPCASGLQGMATAMFDLVERHHVSLGQVKEVRVSLPKAIHDMHGIFPRYHGKFEALLSTHYVVTAILKDRALTLTQFEPARYEDPTLRKFAAEQVVMKRDTTLTGMQAAVAADTTDGKTLTVRCEHSKGSPENPLTRAQIEEKFRVYATGRLPAEQIDEVIGTVARLEDLKSTRRLMDILRAS
jgi:2-methylcitrate dehydratase PrpD